MKCFDCKNRSMFPNEICPLCHSYDRYEPKPTTNYDRFRAITAEELARWLALHPCLPNCPAQTETCLKESKLENCAKRWLDWLKQEASK